MMEILSHHLSYFACHLFRITSRDHMERLGPGGPHDSGLFCPAPLSLSPGSHCSPTGCLSLAMCPAVEAGDSLRLHAQVVPDTTASDISSNIRYYCNISTSHHPWCIWDLPTF